MTDSQSILTDSNNPDQTNDKSLILTVSNQSFSFIYSLSLSEVFNNMEEFNRG